jgi:hypothetical protein
MLTSSSMLSRRYPSFKAHQRRAENLGRSYPETYRHYQLSPNRNSKRQDDGAE